MYSILCVHPFCRVNWVSWFTLKSSSTCSRREPLGLSEWGLYRAGVLPVT